MTGKADPSTSSDMHQPLERCPMCRYSLQGLPSAYRCPECGFEYDEYTRLWRRSIGGSLSGGPAAILFILLLICITQIVSPYKTWVAEASGCFLF